MYAHRNSLMTHHHYATNLHIWGIRWPHLVGHTWVPCSVYVVFTRVGLPRSVQGLAFGGGLHLGETLDSWLQQLTEKTWRYWDAYLSECLFFPLFMAAIWHVYLLYILYCLCWFTTFFGGAIRQWGVSVGVAPWMAVWKAFFSPVPLIILNTTNTCLACNPTLGAIFNTLCA